MSTSSKPRKRRRAESSSEPKKPKCAACKISRKNCGETCVFAPYFPKGTGGKFNPVKTIFGEDSVARILGDLSTSDERQDAVNSLVYEANQRIRDNVYGISGLICNSQQRLKKAQDDLLSAKKELARYIGDIALTPNLRELNMKEPSLLGPMLGIGPVGTTGLDTPSNIPPTAPVFKPDPFTPAEGEDSRPKDKNSNERRKKLPVRRQGVEVTKLGLIIPISGSDFAREVLQAPSDVWVVVIVYKDGCSECETLMPCMEELAANYSTAKFVKILSTDCYPTFSVQNLPSVLVYKNGAVHTSDREFTLKGVAQILSQSDPGS